MTNGDRYALADLERLARALLVAAGVEGGDAAITAEGLLAADRRGVRSHGIAHLPRRLERLVLDMATSAAAWGKVEVAARERTPIPAGIALDGDGRVTTDAILALAARALLPLGGQPETGAFKGFGLGILVDVFTAVLSGG